MNEPPNFIEITIGNKYALRLWRAEENNNQRRTLVQTARHARGRKTAPRGLGQSIPKGIVRR
jgi:hypothetical protein